jgi:ABC-type transport system involved in multi-copper enzyme maturation permease subunit
VLSSLLRFEWRYHTRQASFVAAAVLFLVMGFVLTATGFGPDNIRANAPWVVMESIGLLSLLSLFVVAVFASNAILRDVEHNMLEIVYTTPVGRFQYLFGRFTGAALAGITVAALSVVGMLAGGFMPWLDPSRSAGFTLLPHAWALAVVMLPNVLFATALLFAIAALTRSSIATYVGAVITYFLYFAVSALTNSPIMAASKPGVGGGAAVALLDPFGLSGFFELTRHWSIAEKNDRFVPLAGAFLANRLLWIGIVIAIFAVVYRAFSFRVLRRSRKQSKRPLDIPSHFESAGVEVKRMPVRVEPSWRTAFLSALKLEWKALVWNVPFLLLVLLWLALGGSELYSDLFDSEFRTARYPMTSLIINALRQTLELAGTIVIVYLGTEIFWREQQTRMSSLIDATPVAGSAIVMAKWTALCAVVASFIASAILLGMGLQLARGYPHFEPLLYLSQFYFVGLPLFLLAAVATLIHVFSPGKYVGMVLVVLFVVFQRMTGMLGLEHMLWQFGGAPTVTFSDMDHFGPNARPFHWLMLHWSLLGALLLLIASTAWRDLARPLAGKLRHMRGRATTIQRASAVALLTLFAVSAAWIFYNTNIRNEYRTSADVSDWRTLYEKTYRHLASEPQPSVTAIDIRLDFFPDDGRYHVASTEVIENRTKTPIGTVWVAVRRDADVRRLAIDGARLAATDPRFAMSRFEFAPALPPGGRTHLRYEYDVVRRGFEDGDQDAPVLTNGTMLLGFRIFPTFGYRRGYELADPRERAKRGLPPRAITERESDAFEASQEPRMLVTATLSTSPGQTAIGPGLLERAWEEEGRRFFRYRTPQPIANDAGFGTGRWTISRRRVNDIDVEMYAHHPQNAKRMLDAACASIQTFERSFRPYPLGVLRMAEVPRQNFGGYASPGIVWFAESRTPVTDARDANRVDITTRRVVHEVAHQWWGHQLVPPAGPGASLLVETFAKHSESMMIERLRGREQLDQFLEMELDRYLSGRSREGDVEEPLLRVDGQSYVYYAKGAIVMNALVRDIGEALVNDAIRGVLQMPFPKAEDFVSELRRVSPERAALHEEWLRDIVLYDLRIDSDSARARRLPNGSYDVALQVTARKSHADQRGNERAVPMRETIELATYSDDGSQISIRRVELHDGTQTIAFTAPTLPGSIALDPHVTRIDKDRGNNFARIVP